MNNNKPSTSTVKNQDDIKTIYPSKNTNQEPLKNTMIIHINSSLQKNNHTSSSSQRKKSKIPVKLKNYPLSSKSSPTSSTKSGLLTNASSSKSSFKSKIPQFQPQQQHSQTNDNNNKSGEESFSTKYGTYTKKKPTNTSVSSTSMINSITFDKNSANDRSSCNRNSSKVECNEVKILLTNPNQSQTVERQNILDIVLVPINNNINENRENETTDNSLEIMTTQKDTSRVKIRDDEGYSTMSSELMHQIKPNPTDLSARSSISTKKGI